MGRYLQVLPGTCRYFNSGSNTRNDTRIIPISFFLCIEPVTLGTLWVGTCKYFWVLAGTLTVDFRYCWVLLTGI